MVNGKWYDGIWYYFYHVEYSTAGINALVLVVLVLLVLALLVLALSRKREERPEGTLTYNCRYN
jgi:hypothetical protein